MPSPPASQWPELVDFNFISEGRGNCQPGLHAQIHLQRALQLQTAGSEYSGTLMAAVLRLLWPGS